MQKPQLEIKKYTYYTDGRAFGETAPPSDTHDHSVCNCTQFVNKRPENAPIRSMKMGLSLHSEEKPDAFHKGEMDISVGLGTFFFDNNNPTKYKESDFIWFFIRPYENHVYLYLHKNKLRFEYHIPGYGYVDYIMPKIYRGNDHDKSCLMNGHSPSRINTTVDDERQLWAHDCCWGKETFTLLESDTLQRMLDTGNEMLDIVSGLQVSHDSEVEDIYKKVKESLFEEKSAQIESLLREFDLRNDPIFDSLHAIECEAGNVQSMFERNK